MRKIIGVTVGTPLSISKIEKTLKPIKTVNRKMPDENGNVEVTVDVSGTVESKVTEHNVEGTSHNDIRLLISELSTRLNTIANSTDEDLDQIAELVAYIKNNKSLIDGITTSKVNVEDIVDNLTTSTANKPLSANQGVELKALVDALGANLTKFEEADAFHDEAIVSFTNNIVDHESRLTEQSSNISNLTTRVASLEGASGGSGNARIVSTSTTIFLQAEPNVDYVYRYAIKYFSLDSFKRRDSSVAERWSVMFKVGKEATIKFLPTIYWAGGTPEFAEGKAYWMYFVPFGNNNPVFAGFWVEVPGSQYET